MPTESDTTSKLPNADFASATAFARRSGVKSFFGAAAFEGGGIVRDRGSRDTGAMDGMLSSFFRRFLTG
jgi:hypothetical protein